VLTRVGLSFTARYVHVLENVDYSMSRSDGARFSVNACQPRPTRRFKASTETLSLPERGVQLTRQTNTRTLNVTATSLGAMGVQLRIDFGGKRTGGARAGTRSDRGHGDLQTTTFLLPPKAICRG
jgi:hypothetical protein